jgi:hypothetical protein
MYQQWVDVSPVTVKKVQAIERGIRSGSAENGLFLSLKILKTPDHVLSENFYWFPDSTGNYPIIQNLGKCSITASANRKSKDEIGLDLSNGEGNPVAFFVRISAVDKKTRERILPVFYSDNYISMEPGGHRSLTLNGGAGVDLSGAEIQIEGWNVDSKIVQIE